MNQANIIENTEISDNEEFKSDDGDETPKEEKPKVEIKFPYSEIIRGKAPRVFAVAETVATQWKNDEKFENLGIPHPLAEAAAAKALEKAKEVEKKLEEKGVFTAAKMGVAVAKAQAEELLNKIKKS